jgi:hypothetical protein
VDLLAYGSSYGVEGTTATYVGDATSALTRGGDGCADTNNNSLDFAQVPPVPKDAYFNPATPCACP